MKISIIGAGNVGALTAKLVVQEGLGNVVLVDIAQGLAEGKSWDIEDSSALIRCNCSLLGTGDIEKIKDADIVVLTAGFTRQPGMSREDLMVKNSQIIKEISLNIKRLASRCIVIVVTNPLDLMTYLTLKTTGFDRRRVLGMGITLDAARFANLISKELKIPTSVIEAQVIGSHGEAMLPLTRLTYVKGIALDEVVDEKMAQTLVERAKLRGQEIVSLLGKGSAYFAPAQAITEILRAIVKDQKRVLGVCAYLNGEYGLKDVCLGVPCSLGKSGIEKIIALDLSQEEKTEFLKSADSIRRLIQQLPI